MKKNQKGITLIEVLVSISVFAIISLALFSSVIAMQNVITRQEEYAKIEMVCYDIDTYCEKYNENWSKNYFNGEIYNGIGYLTSEFKPTNDPNQGHYVVRFTDSEILSITNKDNSITFVENVKLK